MNTFCCVGGVCLTPDSLIDGLKIFEMEPFLSLQTRKPNNHCKAERLTDVSIVCMSTFILLPMIKNAKLQSNRITFMTTEGYMEFCIV